MIDTLPAKHKRNKPEVLAGMDVLAKGSIDEIIYAKAGERRFVRQKELARELGLLDAEMKTAAAENIASGALTVLPDDTLVNDNKLGHLRQDMLTIAEDYHSGNPLADGIPRQELLSRLKERWFTDDDRLVQAFVKYMIEQGVIEDRGRSIAVSGFSIDRTSVV